MQAQGSEHRLIASRSFNCQTMAIFKGFLQSGMPAHGQERAFAGYDCAFFEQADGRSLEFNPAFDPPGFSVWFVSMPHSWKEQKDRARCNFLKPAGIGFKSSPATQYVNYLIRLKHAVAR